MKTARVNGIAIAYEEMGTGDIPVFLVHGSWGSRHNWDRVAPLLASRFGVVAYDRRGHSESERPPGQGSIHEDVADLAALIEHLDAAPAWVVGNSWGAVITLRLAAARPELLRGIAVHEPPLIALIADDPVVGPIAQVANARLAAVIELLAEGKDTQAARLFVETVAFGPGAWDTLPPAMQQTFVLNAPTYLDECRDPEQTTMDLTTLAEFTKPALITHGDQSPPMFPAIVDVVARAIPQAEKRLFPGAGHIPHTTHPNEFAEAVRALIEKNAN